MYNFRIKNNYIFCDLPNGNVAEGLCKNVEFHLTNHTQNCFINVKNLNNWDGMVITLNDVKVEGQTLNITEFIDWITANTGNFKSPNSGATFSTKNITINLPHNSEDDFTINSNFDIQKLQQIELSNIELDYILKKVTTTSLILKIINKTGTTINENITITIKEK